MSAPIITIDLHGLFQDEAIKVIDKALKNADSSTYQIKLIHGYNRGTSLKNMLLEEHSRRKSMLSSLRQRRYDLRKHYSGRVQISSEDTAHKARR